MLGHLKHQDLLSDGPLVIAWDHYGEDVIVVSLAGEMDASNVGSARDVIEAETSGEPDEILLIDLSALEFIDSAGIALLVRLAAADPEGTHLRIVPSPALAVSRIMYLTGVDAMIQIARERPARAA